MRIVNVKHLRENMIIGKTVYSETGEILLKKDVFLTKEYIQNLNRRRIPAVYINDELSDDIEIEEALDYEVKAKCVHKIRRIYEKMAPRLSHGKPRGYIDFDHYTNIRKIIFEIMDNLESNDGALYNMVEVMSTDLTLYTHSVNVAALSLMTGRALGMNEHELLNLGVGALLHDIGKVMISAEILNKPAKLTKKEFEIIKTHPLEGYRMVQDNSSISSIAKNIILCHHERLDGSGYPNQLKSNKINEYARIVAIADMFEAMVSERAYRRKFPIYQALDVLMAETIQALDVHVFRTFVKNITLYPGGTGVLLSTGEKALVVENRNHPTRPKTRIVRKADGKAFVGMKFIDLMQELTLFIDGTCDL